MPSHEESQGAESSAESSFEFVLAIRLGDQWVSTDEVCRTPGLYETAVSERRCDRDYFLTSDALRLTVLRDKGRVFEYVPFLSHRFLETVLSSTEALALGGTLFVTDEEQSLVIDSHRETVIRVVEFTTASLLGMEEQGDGYAAFVARRLPPEIMRGLRVLDEFQLPTDEWVRGVLAITEKFSHLLVQLRHFLVEGPTSAAADLERLWQFPDLLSETRPSLLHWLKHRSHA